MIKERQAAVSKLPRYDISNEAFREYIYPDGTVLRVEGAVTLILERKDGIGQDRHRLIIKDGDREIGMYVAPGWRGIRWQTPRGKHGITF